jgi:S1-C subfamily serine protease
VPVTIADRTKLYGAQLGLSEESQQGGEAQPSKLGITVSDVTPDIADRMGLSTAKGVIVDDVKPGSFADEDLNLQRGDVILEMNKKPVANSDDFRRMVGELKSGEDVALLIHPSRSAPGTTVFAAGTLP